jgi:hypothetical protein
MFFLLFLDSFLKDAVESAYKGALVGTMEIFLPANTPPKGRSPEYEGAVSSIGRIEVQRGGYTSRTIRINTKRRSK